MTDTDLWWSPDIDEGERHPCVIAQVKQLEEAQYESRLRDLRNGWLYDQRCRLMGASCDLRAHANYVQQSPVIENVVRSAIDTLTSMIAKVRPRVAVLTDDGAFELQHRAKQLERFLEAEFRRLDVYTDMRRMFRDACIYGTGILKVYEAYGAPAVDHVLLDEIVVDEEEARMYAPREIFQRRFVDRWVLAAQTKARTDLSKQQKQKILDAIAAAPAKYISYRRPLPHQLLVFEGWRLPSVPGADDGRWVQCIDGADLFDEPWEEDEFPFLFMRYSEPSDYGFWGVGICEIAAGKQNRINRHNRFIATAQDRVAIPRWFVKKGTLLKPRITNEVGLLIETTDPNAVKQDVPQAVPPEIYSDRRELRATLFEDIGVSQLQASAKKPVGIESAPAQREFVDITSERFATVAQDYEGTYPTIGERIIRVSRKAYARDKTDHKSTWHSNDLRRTIPWSKINLDRDRYSLTLETASMLTRSPSGRKQEAIDRFSMGLWTAEKVNKVLGDMDVEGESELVEAPVRYSNWVIEGLIDQGVPMTRLAPTGAIPELPMVIDRIGRKRTLLQTQGADHEVLERFTTWLEQATFVLNPPQPPAQPEAAAMGAPPPAGAPPMPPDAGVPPEASQPFIAAGAQAAAGV